MSRYGDRKFVFGGNGAGKEYSKEFQLWNQTMSIASENRGVYYQSAEKPTDYLRVADFIDNMFSRRRINGGGQVTSNDLSRSVKMTKHERWNPQLKMSMNHGYTWTTPDQDSQNQIKSTNQLMKDDLVSMSHNAT